MECLGRGELLLWIVFGEAFDTPFTAPLVLEPKVLSNRSFTSY